MFCSQGCVFTQDINQAIYISDAMETGTVQVNAAPARGPDVSPTVVSRPLEQQQSLIIRLAVGRATTDLDAPCACSCHGLLDHKVHRTAGLC